MKSNETCDLGHFKAANTLLFVTIENHSYFPKQFPKEKYYIGRQEGGCQGTVEYRNEVLGVRICRESPLPPQEKLKSRHLSEGVGQTGHTPLRVG